MVLLHVYVCHHLFALPLRVIIGLCFVTVGLVDYFHGKSTRNPVSILHKSIAGRYRPVRVADGSITSRCRFMQSASWEDYSLRSFILNIRKKKNKKKNINSSVYLLFLLFLFHYLAWGRES